MCVSLGNGSDSKQSCARGSHQPHPLAGASGSSVPAARPRRAPAAPLLHVAPAHALGPCAARASAFTVGVTRAAAPSPAPCARESRSFTLCEVVFPTSLVLIRSVTVIPSVSFLACDLISLRLVCILLTRIQVASTASESPGICAVTPGRQHMPARGKG